MSIDGFLNGLDRLVGGVNAYQRSGAIKQANKAVANLRGQELDEFDKTMKLGEIVQDFSFNLMRTGASAKEATGLTAILFPQASTKFYQSVDSALINATPGSREYNMAEKIRSENMSFKTFNVQEAGRRSDARTEGVKNRFDQNQQDKAIKGFNDEPYIKELKENLGLVQIQRSQLDAVLKRIKGGDPNARAERVTVKQTERVLARLVSNQRLSEQAAQEAGLSQTWYNKAIAVGKSLVSEDATNRDIEVAVQLIDQFNVAGTKLLGKKASAYTRRQAPTLKNLGFEPVEFRNTIQGLPEGLGADIFPDNFDQTGLGSTNQSTSPTGGSTGDVRNFIIRPVIQGVK